MLPLTAQIVLLLLTGSAAWFDWRERRVPNWLAALGALAAAGFALYAGTWPAALEGLALALLIYLPLWKWGVVGAGDAKLMAIVGSFLGPVLWFVVFVGSMAASGIWGVLRGTSANPHAVAVLLVVATLLAVAALR